MKNGINHIDGWLYVGIAVAGAVTAAMTSSDAEKFITPAWLFLIKTYAAIFGAACLAAKTYRSTTFASQQRDQRDAGPKLTEDAVPPAPLPPAETAPKQ